MPFSLIPDQVFDRYTRITPQFLRERGVRLLLCDLDYTLAPRSVSRPDGELRRWLEECRAAGVTVAILSNNRSTRRVAAFCGELSWGAGHLLCGPRGKARGAGLPPGHGPGRDRACPHGHAGGQATHRRAGCQAQRCAGADGGAAGRAGGGVEPGAPRLAETLQMGREKEKVTMSRFQKIAEKLE